MSRTDSIVLVCTVGGSPQPVVTAIQAHKPFFVEFVCTDRDPGTGRPGSCVGITGNGKVLKSKSSLTSPDLPSIPVQTGMSDEQYHVTLVPGDELDQAFDIIYNCLMELRSRFPDSLIRADYTGGTKTMTAALVAAVLETEDVELQLVTGNRPDLVKVKDGTQIAVTANIDSLRYRKAVQPFLAAWHRFAYDEAWQGISALAPPPDIQLRSLHLRMRDFSNAFAAWDQFDHAKALHLLDDYGSAAGSLLGPYLANLRILTTENLKREPLQILDLWRNAERRAVQGRYGDAVGRCYRAIEWTAQWILSKNHGVDTSNLPADFVPRELKLIPSLNDRLQAALYNAWELIRLKDSGPGRQFIETHSNRLKNLLNNRNQSILAHGTTPVGQVVWAEIDAWMEQALVPLILEEAADVGIRKKLPQLPNDPNPYFQTPVSKHMTIPVEA